MDLATVIGIVAGFGCVFASVLSGGDASAFVHVPSAMIVIGGMLSSTAMHFSGKQFIGIFGVMKKTLLHKTPTSDQLIQKMVNYAAVNRRDGALALEQHLKDIKDPFMSKAIQMIVDGTDVKDIREQLELETDYLAQRHEDGKKIIEFMGASAPAFGMIGTLIGLVQMLGSLDSPDNIGAGMAVALITTFYGAILANLVFIPLGGKLGIRSKGESAMREMISEGVIAIVSGGSPTNVREKMHAFLSERNRKELKPQM